MKSWRGTFFFSATRARIYSTGAISAFVLFVAASALAASPLDSTLADLKSPTLETRFAALENLKGQSSQTTAQAVASVAVRDGNVHVRLLALDVLGGYGVVSVIPTIEPLLRDTSASLRQRAARTIGMLGGSDAEEALLTRWPSETDASVQAAIVQGLSLCASSRSLQTLQAALSHPDSAVRKNAENAMQRLEGGPLR